jgi:L-alanine-DL-glutamate epimerase-like enolase superfamily enzyme
VLRHPVFQIEDGMAIPTAAPGLGIDLDETALGPWLVTP